MITAIRRWLVRLSGCIFYLSHLYNLCLLNLFIYSVLGYHIRWWNKVVYIRLYYLCGWETHAMTLQAGYSHLHRPSPRVFSVVRSWQVYHNEHPPFFTVQCLWHPRLILTIFLLVSLLVSRSSATMVHLRKRCAGIIRFPFTLLYSNHHHIRDTNFHPHIHS